MTNDYKELTLKYVTGNITPEGNEPNSFRDMEVANTNIVTALADKGISSSLYHILTTTTTSNYLIYGNYLDSQDNKHKGYIAVMDQNSNVLEVLTQYETGTDLLPIDYLDYDENGNIYGLDQTFDLTQSRVILLNNIALETPRGYFCKLRASYYIDSNYDTAVADYSVPHLIRKIPGEPIYFIFGSYYDNGYKVCLIKFVNNVGMPNEWDVYTGHTIGNYLIRRNDFLVEKDGEDFKAYVYYAYDDISKLRYEYFNGTSLGGYTETQLAEPIMCIRVFSPSIVYYTTRTNNNDGTYTMYLYKKGIEETSLLSDYVIEASIPTYNLYIENGIVYGLALGYKTVDGVLYYGVKCIVYDGKEVVVSDLITYHDNSYLQFNTAVQSTFALHKFIIPSEDGVRLPSVVIYDDYSGSAIETVNSVTPQKGELYSNSYICFARNLYNRQVYNNLTISTIEVPNGYLNDLTIDEENVLSVSNNILNSEADEIQKNIYETLYLNFNNYLNVIDEDTSIVYPEVATYINKSINNGSTYNDTHLGKLRINYNDSTVMQNITWEQIDATHYQTKVAIDTTEVPVSMDFMSNDEQTIYLTKELNLDQNKCYILTQKIRIE